MGTEPLPSRVLGLFRGSEPGCRSSPRWAHWLGEATSAMDTPPFLPPPDTPFPHVDLSRRTRLCTRLPLFSAMHTPAHTETHTGTQRVVHGLCVHMCVLMFTSHASTCVWACLCTDSHGHGWSGAHTCLQNSLAAWVRDAGDMPASPICKSPGGLRDRWVGTCPQPRGSLPRGWGACDRASLLVPGLCARLPRGGP